MINLKTCNSKEEVFDSIRKYLQSQIDLARRKMESEESFNTQAWAAFQANQLGVIRTLKKVLDVIPDREKK